MSRTTPFNSHAQQIRILGHELVLAIASLPCRFKPCSARPLVRCKTAFGVPLPYHKVRVEDGRKKLADAAAATA